MLQSIIKMILLKCRYGNKIKVGITSNLSLFSIFNIKNGTISFGRGFGVKKNTKISANGGKIIIGKGVNFNHNCMCISHESIIIGDNSSFGPNVCIYDHDHDFDSNGKIKGKFKSSEIVIEENVWIGANTTILRGTHIGKNSIIGAGSVIKGFIPENSLIKSDRSITIEALR